MLRGLLLLLALLTATVPAHGDDRLLREERFSEALGGALQALEHRLQEDGPLHPATVAALQQAGVVAHRGGDQRTAEEVLRAVVELRHRQGQRDAAMVRALLDYGRAARYRGHGPAAGAAYAEAERLVAALPAAPADLRADVLQERGDFARRTHPDMGPAIALYRRALAVRRAGGARPSLALADNLTWLAWMLSRSGRWDEAATLAHEARATLQEIGLPSHSLMAALAGLLADREFLQGRADRSIPWRRGQAAIGEAARDKQLGGFSRRLFPLDGYEGLALAALQEGNGEEAWSLSERGLAAANVDFATMGLWQQRDPATWTVARRLRADLQDAKSRLLAASGGQASWAPATAPLFLRVLRLRVELDEVERRYLLAHRPRVPTLDGVSAALGPKSALVGWLDLVIDGGTLPERYVSYAYVLRPGRPLVWVRCWEARSAADYRSKTQEYVVMLNSLQRAASWRRRVDPDPEMAAGLRAWGAQLFDPLLPHLDGVERLVLERPLYPCELAVLPSGRSLGDTFDVSQVPSALTLQLLAERRAPARPDRVLAVSGPSDEGLATIGALVNMSEVERSHRQLRSAYRRDEIRLQDLPRLRYAGLEARSVAARFPRSTVLAGRRSVEGTLDGLARGGTLRQFGLVHLAGHTLTDSAPECCAMALSERKGPGASLDGLLEVEDIVLDWELDADLLTLSGCETLRAGGATRQDPLGFLPALFGSGARRILSSLWTVDDRATAILMDRFYENLSGRFRGERLGYRASPLPPARALREAKRYVRTLQDAGGRRPFEHPAYWGGFVLTGLP